MIFRLIKLFSVVVALVPLASCNSFNNVRRIEIHSINNQYPPAVDTSKTETVKATKTWQEDYAEMERTKRIPTDAVCPKYKAPSLGKVPELPLKELAKISPNDTEALDRLQRQHIEELRLYIAKMRATIVKSQYDYLKECEKYSIEKQ